MQLVTPGRDPSPVERVPAGMRAALATHAVTFIPLGLLLFAAPDTGQSLWPWALTDLTAKAVGTWLAGIGLIAGYIALRGDREDLPGNALAYLVLGAGSLAALARFPGDVDSGVSAVVFAAYAASVLLVGAWSALLSLREGRYARVLPPGGVPVELADPAPRGAPAPANGRALARR
jgi:hypothetical protein